MLEFFYEPLEVGNRYRDISASVNMDKGGFEAEKVTMWQTFTDPNLRTPALLAIALMVSQ